MTLCCSPRLKNIFLIGLGATFLIIGGILSIAWPIVFNSELRKQLVLKEGSRSYNLWVGTPIPLYLEFYLFNWTNPDESFSNNVLPNFVEIGPYVFREEHKKKILNWNKNGTVTFKQLRQWFFLRDQSVGELSDVITNVNVIAMTVGNLVKKFVPKIVYPLINDAIRLEHKIYVTKTVREWLFDGYNDVFLDIVKDLKPILKFSLPFDKFGWFYPQNNTENSDGTLSMMTGETTLDKLGLVTDWNGKTGTSYFPGDCGKVRGTGGELWPITSPSKSKVAIFAPNLCSWVELDYYGSTSVHGATGTVFTGTENTLSNSTTCFCVNKVCHPSGVREISSCRYQAPAFVSFPHFYLADPSYRQLVTGLLPDSRKHRFDITLHDVTSVPLLVNAKFQINILVDKIPGLKFFEKLSRAYIPTVWFNQRAEVTNSLASEFSGLEVYSWFEPGFLALTCLGLALFLLGLYFWARRRIKIKRESESLIADSSSS